MTAPLPQPVRPRRSDWVMLLALYAVVLASRLAPFGVLYHAHPDRIQRPDSGTYEQPALAMLETGRFSSSPDHPEIPETHRTPGYPLLIAAAYLVAGPNPAAAIVLQNVLFAGVPLLVWLIAWQIWRDRRAAWLAAVLVALDPLAWLYAQLMLSDAPYVVAFGLFCLLAVALLRARRHEAWLALATGLALAAATFIRPISYYLIVPLALGFLAAKWRGGRGRALATAGCLVLAFALPAGAWQWRNLRLTGDAEFCTIQSHNLLFYRGAGIVSIRDGITFEAAQDLLGKQARKAVPAGANTPQWYAYCKREAVRLIRENPIPTLRMSAAGAIRMLIGPGGASFDAYFGRRIQATRYYSLAYMAVLYLLLAGGLWRGWRAGGAARWRMALLMGMVAYLIAVAAGPEAYSRFSLPLVPIFAVYAGGGAAWLARRIQGR